MKWLISLVILLSQAAGAAATPDPQKSLKDSMMRIQKAKMIRFRMEKTVVSEVMGTEKKYEARALLAGPLFYFETLSPEKSKVIYDGKTLWIVQYPDPALGGPIQVSKGTISKAQKSQMVLTELLANGKLMKSFDLKKLENRDGNEVFEANPKDDSVSVRKVVVHVKGRELKVLEYLDDIGNKTVLKITEETPLAEFRAEPFRYKPEKGAQVTDL